MRLRSTFLASFFASLVVFSPFVSAQDAPQLVRIKGTDQVYSLHQGHKRPVSHSQVLESWYGTRPKIDTVSAETLEAYKLGKNLLLKPGTLFKIETDPRVYRVLDESGAVEWIKRESDIAGKEIRVVPDSLLSDYHLMETASASDAVGAQPAVVKTDRAVVQPHEEPIVYVREGGTVIHSTNADDSWHIASITKLMTALVLNDMKLNWNAPVTMAKADEVGGARLRVAVGTKYTRNDLLHASLMGSANNSTYALARTSGVPMKEFVARMNAKARSLGMHSTRFVDPTGIELGNISTAEDVAILVETAKRTPRIASVAGKTYYSLMSIAKKPKKHAIKNTNALLVGGEPALLGKTGYLIESRFNFAMVYKTDEGKERTVVVLNAPSQAASFQLARKFANLGP